MYEIPSNPKIEKCIITKETVQFGKDPILVINESKEQKNRQIKKKIIQNKKDAS